METDTFYTRKYISAKQGQVIEHPEDTIQKMVRFENGFFFVFIFTEEYNLIKRRHKVIDTLKVR